MAIIKLLFFAYLLDEKLGAISVKFLIRMAKERGPGSSRLAEAMVLIYNGGKKKNSQYRLNIKKLYEKKKENTDTDLNDEANLLNTASEQV